MEQKQYQYHYHETTGEYLGKSVVEVDPLESEKAGVEIYLIIPYATFEQPPENVNGFVNVRDGNNWAQKEDHRDEKVYSTADKSELLITELGPIPGGYTEEKPGQFDEWDGARWVENTAVALDYVKQKKLSEINQGADAALSSITSPYPESERLSWDKQEQGARAWLADNSTATPLIDAMISGRGTDKADQINRIIQKADAFAAQSGLIFGKRQGYVDQLDAATTVAEVEAITVDYS